MAEEQRRGLPALYNVSKNQAILAGGAFLLSGVVDVATRNPAIALAGLVVATGVGFTSKEILEMTVPGSHPDEVASAAQKVIASVAPDLEVYVDQRALSKLRRLLRVGATPDLYETQDIVMPGEVLARPKDDTLRRASAVDESEQEDTALLAWDDDDVVPIPTVQQGGFTFSEVLARGFRPDLQHIYLGTLDDGTDVIVPVEDLCHVALAGLTGNGKGNIMRLIMSQLCSIGVRVLLLNPHYAGYDQSGGEDWTPFEGNNKKGDPYLQQPPLPCSKLDAIEKYLHWMAYTLLPQRKALMQEYKPIGRPYFMIVDEWPDVVKGCGKQVVESLEKLLREGRKYGIFVVVASQDFQVKTIGVDGGGVRKCFKTVFYVGGDNATARALLGDDVAIPEKLLGKGVVMMRCKIVPSQIARVPYVDNDALYQLLGPSQLPPHILRHGVKVTTEEEELPSTSSKVTRQVQKLQAPLQELQDDDEEGEQVSFEDLCDAVAEMATLHYKNGEIISMLGITDDEYLEIIDYIKAHREKFFPLRPTSRKEDTSTSSPTSQQRPRLQLVNGSEVAQEVARSGQEAGNILEVGEETLSERELQIAQMFYEEKIGINAIMKELYPGVVGGTPYRKGNVEIMEALRKYTDTRKK